MKSIFAATTLLALASALVSATPVVQRRQVITIPASDLWIITNPAPATILTPTSGADATISIVDGSNEIDTIVSFDLGVNPSPISTSTCQFVIEGITPPTGSGIVQLFTLGGDVDPTQVLTSVPYYNQYEGQYDVTTGTSTPIDVPYVPCNFDAEGRLQFVIRPQNTDDYITFTQTDLSGAFILYSP